MIFFLSDHSLAAATEGHSTAKGVHELSFKGDTERPVMNTSHSKLSEVLCIFWKRPLVYKWEGGSPKTPLKERSPGIMGWGEVGWGRG